MKKQSLKTLVSAAILILLGFSSSAGAHIYSGFIINKSVQVLTLNCPAGSARVAAQVLDLSVNKGIMSVTVFKDGGAQTASDLGQGDGSFSSYVTLSAGSGTYYLIASQTAAVTGQYRIQYHCEDAQGAETTSGTATLTQQ